MRRDRERSDAWRGTAVRRQGAPQCGRAVGAPASTGSTHVRVTPGRLRVPLLALAEQRRYGEAFRRGYELRAAVRRTAGLAADTAATMTTGLTAGVLPPPVMPDSGSG